MRLKGFFWDSIERDPQKLKILYDHQIFTTQKYGGISRYFAELISGMSNEKDLTNEVGIVYSGNEYLKALVPGYLYRFAQTGWKIERSFRKRVNCNKSIQLLKKGSFDLFHPTEFNPYFLDYIGKKPYVLTVYDMAHEKKPEFFFAVAGDNTTYNNYLADKKLLIQSAAHIITISDTTKKDIVDILNIPANSISTVYLGNSIKQHMAKNEPIISDPYLLFVGNRFGYKNFEVVLSAFSKFSKTRDSIKLVCCGGGPFTPEEVQTISALKVGDRVVWLNSQTDVGLATLYAHAKAFVFPSHYEGFGLPVIEAASLGCPLILSDIPVFREIAGDVATYFNPLDDEELAAVMLNHFDTAHESGSLKEMSARFTWERTCKSVYQIYTLIK